jgi:hypothetical protein
MEHEKRTDAQPDMLTERQLKAIAGLYYKRSGKVRRYQTKRPFGTDAYIAGEAKTLALNPYRMPSECVLILTAEQQNFLLEMSDVWKRLSEDNAFSIAAAEQIKAEVLS